MKTLLIGILIIAVVLAVISKIHPIGKKVSLYIVLGTWIYRIDHVDSVLHDVRYGNTYNQ